MRPFTAIDEAEVRAAHAVMAAEDFEFAVRLAPETVWSEYLDALAGQRAGTAVHQGWVPNTYLIATVDDVVIEACGGVLEDPPTQWFDPALRRYWIA